MPQAIPHRLRQLRWQARAASGPQALALRQALRAHQEDVQGALAEVLDAVHQAHGLRPDEVLHLPHLALHLPAPPDLSASPGQAQQWRAGLRSALHEQVQVALVERLAGQLRPEPNASASASALSLHEALRQYLRQGQPGWVLAGLGPAQALAALQAEAPRWLQAEAGTAELAHADPTATVRALWRWAGVSSAQPDSALGVLSRWLALWPVAERAAWVRWRSPRALWPHLEEHLPAATGRDLLAAWQARAQRAEEAALPWQALWLAWPEAPDPHAAWPQALREAPWPADLLPLFAPAHARAKQAAAPHAPPTSHAPSSAATPTSPPPKLSAAADTGAEAGGQAGAGLPVPLAGLVLLHPFLSSLFQACGLHSGQAGVALADAALGPALGLLHSLAQGGEPLPVPELALPFAKLLLGREPDQPLTWPALPPEAHALAEARALLEAVRQHWPALRGSSAQSLAVSFLQRPGLLRRTPGEATPWRLHVHSETFDLLLATLPWPLGFIKLPWMPAPLAVEWPTP